MKRFTLYWSSLKMYEDCPQKFLWSKGWGKIDLGQGPGRKKKLPIKPSKHHAIMGIVLANFWEWLYNDEEWKHPDGMVDRLLEKASKDFGRLLLSEHVDYRLAPSRDEMWEVIENGIRGYIKTMKHQRLLGPYARSEVDLTAYVDKYTPVGGRADLILRREDEPHKGISILDGKNSRRYKNRKTGGLMTYTDPDQLRWYAMCFYLAYKTLPDHLGFVYFRYPWGEDKLDADGNPVEVFDENTGFPIGVEKEEGVEWIPFSMDDIKGIAIRARDAVRSMNREKFDPTPSPSTCRMCDYETVCEARQAQKEKNRRRRKKKTDDFDGLTGFVKFGLDQGATVVVDDE